LATPPNEEVAALVDAIFASTPLLFIKQFLRSHRKEARRVRIGATRDEVRENLKDALIARQIGYEEARQWYSEVEGWGRQHLYLSEVPKRSLVHPHLLNPSALTSFLKRKGHWGDSTSDGDHQPQHTLTEVSVDDEAARMTWRCHTLDTERHENLDYTEERADGVYEFRAFRLLPRRTASRVIVRKTDGIVAVLVDLPLGADHDVIRVQMGSTTKVVLAPLTEQPIHLAPIVSALDEGAIAAAGPRAKRELELGVAPRQARYRTDGAKVEFKTTRESAGYTESDAVRHVRRALRIESFVGEAGKFRLTFEGQARQPHDMIVSLNGADNRIYLYSRMSEPEVFGLIDQLITLRPK